MAPPAVEMFQRNLFEPKKVPHKFLSMSMIYTDDERKFLRSSSHQRQLLDDYIEKNEERKKDLLTKLKKVHVSRNWQKNRDDDFLMSTRRISNLTNKLLDRDDIIFLCEIGIFPEPTPTKQSPWLWPLGTIVEFIELEVPKIEV